MVLWQYLRKGAIHNDSEEKLEQTLVEYGLHDYEYVAMVERVVRIVDENDFEIKYHWDKVLEDYVPPGKKARDYTLESLQEVQDTLFSGLLNIDKSEARDVLYVRLESLAQLILRLK